MKLLRYGPKGSEKPGLLDADGQIRDLSGHVADINGAQLSPAGLKALAAIDPKSLPLVEGSPRYGVPVGSVGKFLAIGLNFADHAKEAGLEPPPEPIFFTKAISCGWNIGTTSSALGAIIRNSANGLLWRVVTKW